jgi:replicative DNA helicase
MADKKAGKARFSRAGVPKCPSGIRGLDEITGGGLPRGRPTLVAGSAGCGKTLFAMEFLVRGALEHGEPGVFMALERDLSIPVFLRWRGSSGFVVGRNSRGDPERGVVRILARESSHAPLPHRVAG